MKMMPQIQKVMTTMPHTIGGHATLKQARSLMSEHSIRHLPVLEGGKLVGILTDRDIAVASSFEGASEMKVNDVMMPMTYVVTPETPLSRVTSEMAEHKYGSAVVQQENGKVVGIFTAVDGLRVLSELLHENYRGS